eukprot:4010062-Pyramimonas_sp.AAC.1
MSAPATPTTSHFTPSAQVAVTSSSGPRSAFTTAHSTFAFAARMERRADWGKAKGSHYPGISL